MGGEPSANDVGSHYGGYLRVIQVGSLGGATAALGLGFSLSLGSPHYFNIFNPWGLQEDLEADSTFQ